MSNWSIQNYKTAPASNQAVAGIDISDASGRPGGLNGALRQIMADVAASGLRLPKLHVSADAGNALSQGDDGNLHADPGSVAGGVPRLYISGDADNALTAGRDGRLHVSRQAVMEKPWNKVTGKPAAGPPVPHAAGHGPDGADAIPTFFPSGVICLWFGDPAKLPAGWALCDGFGGTPDLRDSFVLGAGLSYAPNATGGSASFGSEGRVSGGGPGGYDSHSHQAQGMTSSLLPNYDASSGRTVPAVQIGYSGSPNQMRMNAAGSNGGHSHSIVLGASTRPPFVALHFIMKL